MKSIFTIMLLAIAAPVLAQSAPQAPPPLSPEVQQVLTQIHQVGCNAEAQASAQTIAQLQKENADLKAKLQKLDPPPKGGATKH